MRRASVVIGASFGDEGKGLITDYLASKRYSIVVRFNGGAQAGHTVENARGTRHVFSHFGAGTMAGAPTFLSRYFVSNPTLYRREYGELDLKYILRTNVIVDPSSRVTTAYDMIVNQVVEMARADGRHGSVGVGFNETIERSQQHCYQYRILARDLPNPDKLRSMLDRIRREWVRMRLEQLGYPALYDQYRDVFMSDELMEGWLEDAAFMVERVYLDDMSSLKNARNVIFEGAQGLLLDEKYQAFFPHLTRSRTGLRNAARLAHEIGVEELDAVYVTRSYLTRHGAGPMPGEMDGMPYRKIVDATNKPHEFQGSLRFGMLDLGLLSRTIENDIKASGARMSVVPRLAMTCLDQIDDKARFIRGGEIQTTSIGYMVDAAMRDCGVRDALLSYGPTSNCVREE